MARKKTKKTHHRRRRRIGAGGMGDAITTLLGLTGGAIAGAYVSGIAKKQLSTLPAFAPPAIVVVAGYMLTKKVSGNLMKAIGTGMQAAGGLQLVSSFVTIPGLAGLGAILDRTVPRIQNPIGAPGFMHDPINGMPQKAYLGSRLGNALGALYDN